MTETTREENIGDMDMDFGDVQKESIDKGSEPMLLEGTEYSPSLIQHNDVGPTISHKKPKKDANLNVIAQDYVCTPRDITVIESIMSAPKKTKFVDIEDALLSNDDLECLMRADMFLHDGVINAYIYCMLAHDHLRDRAGEKIHIISTFVSGQIKEDGEKDIDPSKYRHIVQHVNTYLQQDMLFIPIDIPRYHWYLAVVNAKKHEIQVLDSLGAQEKRSELATTLLGLEKRLKLGEQSPEFNRDHKWLDLNVTKWKVVEQFQKAIQTDGASCGLFMLNYMEYWTADALSDEFTQEDMKHFRPKLAVILLDSELNKLKGCPLYCQSDDEAVLPNSDLEILDNPPDGFEDKRPTPIPIMPTDQRDLLVGLCNYIMLIDDAEYLEKEWVRTSTPRPMGLSLKKLQGILNMEQSMDNDCFNIAVRILACDEGVLLTDPPIHYMDLQFCSMRRDSTRDQKFCVKKTIQMLTTLFDGWPEIDNNISSCNMIYLSYESIGRYILYVIDKEARRVFILDPIHTTQSSEMKILRHLVKLKSFAREFKEALEIKQPGWHFDISKWQRLFPNGIPTSVDGDLSGYFVFHFMLL